MQTIKLTVFSGKQFESNICIYKILSWLHLLGGKTLGNVCQFDVFRGQIKQMGVQLGSNLE